jgi:glycerol-3-phosphate acyltransferase PlsY
VFVSTRYASVASIVTALALVVFVLVFGYSWPVVVFAVVGSAAIVFSHRQNLRRLFAGTEHRFELRRPHRA